MEEKILEIRIVIKPEDFNKNLQNLITDVIKKKACSEEYGYIIEINKIISWKDMLSRNNGSNIVVIKLEAQTFLPKIGLVVNGIINMIFPQCIFAEYLDIKFVIPANNIELKDFIYENQMFKNNDHIIQIGDIIKIEIVNIRYTKKQFSCIGKLKI